MNQHDQAEADCYEALEALYKARDLFTRAGAIKARMRVNLAISSARGAVRHAAHAQYREERRARRIHAKQGRRTCVCRVPQRVIPPGTLDPVCLVCGGA